MTVNRVTALTTAQLHLPDRFCQPIRAAFGRPPYLVGSAGHGSDGTYRDVDVRLILPDEEFAAACPTRERWELLSLTISVYLSTATTLPVDFQIQRQSEANQKHGKPRNPLGTGRVFAGGGDATPDWDAPETRAVST
jgi:hypothetical protein